jgi:hypothetical protein
MLQHYSSVNGSEIRDGLANVVSLAGFRLAQKVVGGWRSRSDRREFDRA